MAATVSAAANRGWREASKQSLAEQRHLMSSVVSLYALNPLVLPAILLAWLLTMSKLLTKYPVVRTSLYIMAVCWSHAVIIAIRAVAPACFIYAAYAALHFALPLTYSAHLPIFTGWIGHGVLLFCLVEVYFYFHTLRRCARLQARVPFPSFSNARRWLTFRRVEEASRCVAPMRMPRNCVYWRKFKATRPNHPNNRDTEQALQPSADHPLALADEGHHPLEFLKGWFYNIPLKHIKHDNLMTFFAEST
jgi:hypothetical protein